MKKQMLTVLAIFILSAVAFLSPAFAQYEKMIDVGKTGKFHIGSRVRIGDRLLEPGMYKLEHLTKGGSCIIIVRVVKMNRYGRSMSIQKVGDEAAKVNCAVEKTVSQNKNAKILVRRNRSGEREAVQIWLRNEKVRYILPKS